MACSYPQHGWRGHDGKYTPNERNSTGIAQTIPCNSCMQCKLKNSLDWAVRCTHEMQMHEKNSFITLTYDKLPPNGDLNPEHFKLFLNRLRNKLGHSARYFMAGEYGSNTNEEIYGQSKLGRPHFHAIIFGYDFQFSDWELLKTAPNGEKYYTSKELNKLWGHGFAVVTPANFQTAAYISRYLTKKIKGDLAEEHYQRINKQTGEVTTLTPEYNRQSINGKDRGLGFTWLTKYIDDVFPSDEIIIKGRIHQVPRYYTKLLKQINLPLYADIEGQRKLTAYEHKLIDKDTRDYWKKAVDSETNLIAKLLKTTRTYEAQ